MATWIPDGYTERGYIAGVPRLHDALRFDFRPMLPEQRVAWSAEQDRRSPAQRHKAAAELIARQLVNWDLAVSERVAAQSKGALKAGDPVELKAENVGRVNPLLMARVLNVVLGIDPYDDDPDAPAEEKYDEASAAKN